LPRELSAVRSEVRYSLCTLVTRPHEYAEMLRNFGQHGFREEDCEILFVDNSEQNRMDAFAAYNRFLVEARGEYIILCHQDVLLLSDDRAKLDGLLQELTERDPAWAVCGNAGARDNGDVCCRITDPKSDDTLGSFPEKVICLDENFLVVRRSANLALSSDLRGFHWYGADLCRVADVLGYTAYVIDFHLLHKSKGTFDSTFHQGRLEFAAKYARAFRPRWQHVTTGWSAYLGGSKGGSLLARLGWELRKRIHPPRQRTSSAGRLS